jgi:hypothetical protein
MKSRSGSCETAKYVFWISLFRKSEIDLNYLLDRNVVHGRLI